MNPTDLTASELRRLADIIEKKEALQDEISKLDDEIAAFPGVPGSAAPPFTETNGHTRRAPVREKVISVLKRAGTKGMTIDALQSKTGLGGQHLHNVLSVARRKLPAIQRVARGRYAWTDSKN
jgi:hypothetical protein